VVAVAVTNAKHYRRWYNREGDTPAQQMGKLLAEHRRAGLDFFQAWPLAIAAIRFTSIREQQSWHAVWDDVEIFSAWMAAYDRRSNYTTDVVGALAGLAEAVGYSEAQAAEPAAWAHGTAAAQ
jgi:hypothetical protein